MLWASIWHLDPENRIRGSGEIHHLNWPFSRLFTSKAYVFTQLTFSVFTMMRYVDDCLALFENEQEAEQFLKHLNSQHPCIQFIIEKEQNNHIDFLDMTVYHANKVLQTKGHIKPTSTFLYTHYSSESPKWWQHPSRKMRFAPYILARKN